jgi:hypothetical protein
MDQEEAAVRTIKCKSFHWKDNPVGVQGFSMEIECQLKIGRIEYLRPDNGREFLGRRVQKMFTSTFFHVNPDMLRDHGTCRMELSSLLFKTQVARWMNLTQDDIDGNWLPSVVIESIVTMMAGGVGEKYISFCLEIEHSITISSSTLLQSCKDRGDWSWHLGHAKKDTCTICFEVVDPNRLTLELPMCDHPFHKECLQTLFKYEAKCLTCRESVKDAVAAQILSGIL